MEKTLSNAILFGLFIAFAVVFTRNVVPESWHWLAVILLSILWLELIKD